MTRRRSTKNPKKAGQIFANAYSQVLVLKPSELEGSVLQLNGRIAPLEWRLSQIQAELAEACRKKEAARGAALFNEQCRHHSVLGWTEPRRPNWLDLPRELVRRDDSERELEHLSEIISEKRTERRLFRDRS